jgi:3',5'-nucleoside bisphosphate phosphatase
VPRGGLDPLGAILAIRAAGGLPVLAHFREAV